MTVIVEGPPAESWPIKGAHVHIRAHKVINWLSPSNDLATGKWCSLSLGLLLPALSLLAPETFSLALLAESSALRVATSGGTVRLHQLVMLSHTFLVTHGLIKHEIVLLVWWSLFKLLHVTVLGTKLVLHSNDLSGSPHMRLSFFKTNLLFPSFDLHSRIQGNVFALFPTFIHNINFI